MSTCATCGNEYDRAFTVKMNGEEYAFDSFECAIHKLAPECAQCGCRVVGHGMQDGETIYCCANCAEKDGARGLADRH